MSLFDIYSKLYYKYALTGGNLLVFLFRRSKILKSTMEEGDSSVDQSIEAEVQGDALAFQNVSGSAAPIPSIPQFPTQFAQQMGAMFQ